MVEYIIEFYDPVLGWRRYTSLHDQEPAIWRAKSLAQASDTAFRVIRCVSTEIWAMGEANAKAG